MPPTPEWRGGGSGVEAGADVNPLEYLLRELELDLEPAKPVHDRRAGRIGAAVGVVMLLVVTAFVGSRVLDGSDPGELVEGASPSTDASDDSTTESSSDGEPETAPSSGVEQYRGADWIRLENEQAGTLDWIIPDDPKMWEKIRGYADATSVNHGESFTLYVTTAAPSFVVDAYRIGYYQGNGARHIWSSGELPGVEQPPATVDSKTNMAEARWEPSIEVATDASWPPGYYLIRLTSSDGGATFVPMIVRDDGSEAPLLIQSSVTTFQAYNGWGGANHYTGRNLSSETRARVVSFDRPYGGNGSGEFFGREFEFVYFVEQHGFDVTYWTDIDLHERAELALRHKAVISLGHDEYYSTAMRAGLEQARDHGVNIAFFGANAIFRKIRFEDSPLGSSRRQVNYRVASEDPMNGRWASEVTVSWRDAPSNNPENSLIGQMYECNPVKADMVIVDAGAWMFDGTGLENGDKLPDAVGNEYDRVYPGHPGTPDNIQVVAHSPVNCKGTSSYADATYYTHASGAGVFAVGTFWFIEPLKTDCPQGPETHTDCQIQQIVANVLREFSLGPAGERHPSVNNLAEVGITGSSSRSSSSSTSSTSASSTSSRSSSSDDDG